MLGQVATSERRHGGENPALTNVDALASVDGIFVAVYENDVLTNLEGLRDLTRGGVNVYGNPRLDTLEGLRSLSHAYVLQVFTRRGSRASTGWCS